MNHLIRFKDKSYPHFQSIGFASQFAIPFAKYYCKGYGYDIGCNRVEWSYPGSFPIDPLINKWDALNLPKDNVDYIFSSHCLEHLPDWVRVLDYWIKSIRIDGYLFLYLPHYDQEYWRPWNNTKHIHCFMPNIIADYLNSNLHINQRSIMISERDLNHSFTVVAQRCTVD